jgi:hypothetical protein
VRFRSAGAWKGGARNSKGDARSWKQVLVGQNGVPVGGMGCRCVERGCRWLDTVLVGRYGVLVGARDSIRVLVDASGSTRGVGGWWSRYGVLD